MDLTHAATVYKTQPWQEWWLETELAQRHSWAKTTMCMPKPKGTKKKTKRETSL